MVCMGSYGSVWRGQCWGGVIVWINLLMVFCSDNGQGGALCLELMENMPTVTEGLLKRVYCEMTWWLAFFDIHGDDVGYR
jgi:hypothetical protein